MKNQFPDVNLEDKVVSGEGRIVRPIGNNNELVLKVYYRKRK